MAGNYPYFNNNNINGLPVMQAPTTQAPVQCFAVNSREEANRIPIQIGVMYVIINKSQKEIYVKQYNNDGLIDMDIYKDEKTFQPPKQDFDVAKLYEKIEEIQKSLKPAEATNV